MELTVMKNGNLQINNARIIFKNFAGEASNYNREGDRNFALAIDSDEVYQELMDEKNEYGVSWNIKVNDPREDGDSPFMYMKVKVKFNGRGPSVYLVSGEHHSKLDENEIAMLDDTDIQYVNLDIRPYDGIVNGKPFRAAYLVSMEVIQNIDRFAARYAEENN